MILAIWRGHTPKSAALAVIVRDTFAALGWKHEYAAALLAITPAHLSQQLSGIEALNLWRLADLPDEFQREYDRRRAGQRGAVVLEAPDLSLIRGACALGTKAMVKFTTPIETAERKHA